MILLQAQGWLCTTTTAVTRLGWCAQEGISDQRRTYTIHSPRAGTLSLHATYRDLDYQEYFRPTLTCGVGARAWILGASREQLPAPGWFAQHLGDWPAADATYSAAVSAGDTCDVGISFDLRSPPFSAFDITVTLE